MIIRSNCLPAAMAVAVLMISPNAFPQEPGQRGEEEQATLNHGKANGILTDRLKKSHLKVWKSIMEIVLATDREGRPKHPKLYALYHQADASGHVIFVELSMQSSSYASLGGCKIEFQGESTQKEIVVLRLNLGMIGRARVSERNRRADGFIPFEGLGTKERYAEVLGHELAHVVGFLLNSDYLSLYRERKARINTSSQDDQAIERLTSLIERPAETAEEDVWRELKAGRRVKM